MNTSQPLPATQRLILRPFVLEDAAEVQRLAGAWEVARMTLNVPHPYQNGMAENWIARQPENQSTRNFAVVLRTTQQLCGCIGLRFDDANATAEMGYWIGVPFWNKGFCTEAASAVVDHGFSTRDLHKVQARHLGCNIASGRVMQKIGMTREGTLRQHVLRHDEHHDLVCYGILRSEWERHRVLE
jgi:ribosomal-protein-alanine N-acetyltransferase